MERVKKHTNKTASSIIVARTDLRHVGERLSRRRHIETLIALIWDTYHHALPPIIEPYIRAWHYRRAELPADANGSITLKPRERTYVRIHGLTPSENFRIWFYMRSDRTIVLCCVRPDGKTFLNDLPMFHDEEKKAVSGNGLRYINMHSLGSMPDLRSALHHILFTEGLGTVIQADSSFLENRTCVRIPNECIAVQEEFNEKKYICLMVNKGAIYTVRPYGMGYRIAIPLKVQKGETGRKFTVHTYWEHGVGYVFYFQNLYPSRANKVVAVKMEPGFCVAHILSRAETIELAREKVCSREYRKRSGFENLYALGHDNIFTEVSFQEGNNIIPDERREVIREVQRVLQEQYSEEETLLLLSAVNGEEVNGYSDWVSEQLETRVPLLFRNDKVLQDLMSLA
jgi:hypothetical protein